jgi:hypothetical protein
MPIMNRAEWVKLSSKDKVIHRLQRTIDRCDALQKRYDRDRASGRITKPIPFLERT